MQNLVIKEQLRKKVNKSGNSGAVWVPKAWLGEEILITRLETPKLSLKEEILNLLLPHLENISGIFLYGSHSRKEQGPDSDIDILILAKTKFEIQNTKKFDIEILEVKNIKETLQKNPFIYAIIKESKSILNSHLLEELKQIKPNKTNFKTFIKWFLSTTEDSLKSTKEFIELDKLDSDYLSSYSIVYSLILRLRGIFLINSILINKTFSNENFKKHLTKHISPNEFKKIYTIYQNIRDKKTVENIKIELKPINSLYNLLNEEVKNAQ